MAKLYCLVVVVAVVTSWPLTNVVHASSYYVSRNKAVNNAGNNVIIDQVYKLHPNETEFLGNCSRTLRKAFDTWPSGAWFVSDPCHQFCYWNSAKHK